jgi:hypothetical protein
MAEQESSVVIVSNEEEVEQPAEKPQKPQKPQDGTPPVEDNAPEAEPDDDDQDGDDHKSRLQERFKKLTSQREEARADAAKAQQRAADLEARLAALEKPQQAEKAQEPQKPQPADYTDAFEYAEHLAEWAAKQALIARDAEERKKAEESAKAKVVDGWRERLAAVKTEIPDFDEAITASDVVVSDAVRDAIIESDAGPRILYHLAEHPELAKAIADMTPAASLRAIGRLEAKFEKKAAVDEPPATKPKTSKAPAPITPLRSSSTVADAVTADGDFTGSYEDYKRLRYAGKIR